MLVAVFRRSRSIDSLICVFFSHTRCRHFGKEGDDDDRLHRVAPRPGIWYVNQEEDATHMSIVPLWTGTGRQQQFWVKLGRWLGAVEGNRAVC